MTGRASHPAGHTILRHLDPERDRPILVDLWYPAVPSAVESAHAYGLSSGSVAEAAVIVAGSHPTIVLSHGAFGSAGNYSWIAEHLARVGYIVAGVSHLGESPAYGPETIDPASALRPSLRVGDCSYVLDVLTRDGVLGAAVDAGRVGAVGHSSGGATVLELGGAVYDPAAMAAYCSSDVAALDLGCAYARRLPSAAMAVTAALPVPAGRDARIRAIVAMDPALGPGHRDESLASISVPVHVVGSVENDFLPYGAHAGRYAGLIPGAGLTELTAGEGHFVYLDPCDRETDSNGVSLCRDRAGVDRAGVHARLREVITTFLDGALGRA